MAKPTTHGLPASERLIVALDVDTEKDARDIVTTLGDAVSFYKVGYQLFMVAGLAIVRELTGQGKKVFLDLKMDDTPRTVESTVRNMAEAGVVRFFTLQGIGDTARAARLGRGDKDFPKFLQVTYLSSWDVSDLRESFHIDSSKQIDLDDQVINRTRRILDSGCDGVIASGTSVRRLRDAYPEVLIVTPGIRPEGTETQDHKRVLTPYEAIVSGADYIVVGRPVRSATNPLKMAQGIQADIQRALEHQPARPAERRGISFSPA